MRQWTGAGFIRPAEGVVSYILAKDYGVVGDGSTDDTAALQNALDAGAAQNAVVDCGTMIVRITDALTMGGPGLIFDTVPHSGSTGIKVDGYGFTALTIGTGVPLVVSEFQACFWGLANLTRTGTELSNAIYIKNAILSKFQNIRIYNFDGFGLIVENTYDSVFDTVSVEYCGNDSHFAFWVKDLSGDSTNHSTFNRLQVELSYQRAIHIQPETQTCVFNKIHSERTMTAAIAAGAFVSGQPYTITTVGTTNFVAIGAPANTVGISFFATGAGSGTGDAFPVSWVFGGDSCTYGTTLLQSYGFSKLWLRSAYCTYSNFRTDTSVTVDLEAVSTTALTLIEPSISSYIGEYYNQNGKITIVGGNQTDLLANWLGSYANRSFIGTPPIETWYPALSFGGASTGITYTTNSGVYTKIGRIVQFQLEILLTSKGSATGGASITGPPAYMPYPHAAVSMMFYSDLNAVANKGFVCRIDGTGAIIPAISDSDNYPTQLTDGNFKNNSRIMISGSYITD